MSKYTTGEIAKLCGVSVRTVQYYDQRSILVPSELSEGGRRLYSEGDLKRMRLICFLRDLDLPINAISQLLSEEHPENVIDLLLEQQEDALKNEISERSEKLEKLEQLRRETRSMKSFSLESITDIAYVMENKKKLKRIHAIMLLVGIPLEILEWITFFVGINAGLWLPFILSIGCTILGALLLSVYYYKSVAYICPECHTVFKPTFKEMFFARHTPSTRKLTCTSCGHKGFCVETHKQNKTEEK